VNIGACLFFLAAAVAIVYLGIRSGVGLFDDLADEQPVLFDDSGGFANFSGHAEPDPHAGFGAIRVSDPNFSVEGFKTRVAEMFLALHAAENAGDLTPAKRFLDPALYDRLAAALAGGPATRDAPAVTAVADVRPTTARHDDGFDLVRATVVGTRPGDNPLVEYWELVRLRGATSKPDMTIFKCPNCGAPIDTDDPSRCAYCDTRLVADPSLDWVARRIELE